MNSFEKKKRRKGFDFFNDFEELDRYMQSIMDNLVKGFSSEESPFSARDKPVRWGFSIRFNRNGTPVIQQFGNIKRTAGKPVFSEKREPLVDVNYSRNEATITAELPGVKFEEIKIRPEEFTLTIDVESDEHPYYKEIRLDSAVKPESIKTEFKNGILEITLKRATKKERKRKAKAK